MQNFEKVRDVIASVLLVDESSITPSSNLIRDLGAESIDFLDILFRLEEEFHIKLPRGEIERRARGTMSEEEFAKDGVLTNEAILRLQEQMPEVSASEFVPGLMVRDIPRLMTVATFMRIVEEKTTEQEVPTKKQDSAHPAYV